MILTGRPVGKRGAGLALILIVFIAALVYANSLKNSFVWDDYVVIVNNNFVKSWRNLPVIFSKDYLSPFVKRGCCFSVDPGIGSGETSYRPIVTLSYFFDYFLWKLNAFGYHYTNLVLHVINAVLLYFLADLITKSRKAALAASLLFVLHPVNSEAVNVVSFREELLAFLFYLSSFILYIKLNKYHGIKKTCFYICSLIMFFLALFSKEMSVTLPFVLILYDYFFASRKNLKEALRYSMLYYSGYFFILLFYILARFFLIVNITEPAVGYPGGSFYTNILTMSRVMATYIRWVLVPVNIPAIMPNQPYLVSESIFNPRVLFSMALIITCFLIALRMRRSSKESSFSILWFFVTLLPVSNIVPIPNYVASRYLYIPVAGFCLLSAIILIKPVILETPWFSLKIPQKVMWSLAAVILIFYSTVTFIRNTSWKNNTVFHLEMAHRYPDNALVHLGLADSFKGDGLLGRAMSEYREAVRLNPALTQAYNNIAIMFGEAKLYEKAIDCFKQIINIDPENSEAYNNLAVTYARAGKWKEARTAWEKALKISPKSETARSNLERLRKLGY